MTFTTAGIADVVEPHHEIRRMLVERRRELLNDIQTRVRDVRAEGFSKIPQSTQDEVTEAEPQDDLVFALLQMKAEALERVNEAVRRLDEGTYGYCGDCGDLIASSRLRAIPFAVRCKTCQEEREDADQSEPSHLKRAVSSLGARL